MSETLSQKHLDLLNLIAASPPPIDASQMITKLRRPSLEDILQSPTTARKASNRNSMSGIYVRSRPTSFSEFDMAFDPNYDYEDFLARPLSQTAVKETLESLGLRLQQGRSLFMQLSQLQGQLQKDESPSSSSSSDTVVAPSLVRPPKPTRPLPIPDGPPPGYMTVMSNGDGYESDGEEIVYMLDDYILRHQCTVVDAEGMILLSSNMSTNADFCKNSIRAPRLPLPAIPSDSTASTKGPLSGVEIQTPAFLIGTEASHGISDTIGKSFPEGDDISPEHTLCPTEEPQKAEHATSRANKRMGVVGILATPIEVDTPPENTSLMRADSDSRPVTRTRTMSNRVTFAPDTIIKREPKVSLSKAASSKTGEKKLSAEVMEGQIGTDAETLCAKTSATSDQDEIPTPTVEIFEVDFTELEKATPKSVVESTGAKEIKKKQHFGVYKVIRNAFKRNSKEAKVDKPAATDLEEPPRAKTPTPSIATTPGGRRRVLSKPKPALKSVAASEYAMNVASDTASQKSKKPFRAWSIRSGKGGRKGATDPVQIPAQESITGGTGLLAPSATRPIRGLRRSVSFSGFATIATPSWDDPADMDQLLKDAAERLKRNPQREWVYKPKVAPILEHGENPIDLGFVLERHVGVSNIS